jgi:hypothetical protein
VFGLVKQVEDVAARDPNAGVVQLAKALSTYFRTRD